MKFPPVQWLIGGALGIAALSVLFKDRLFVLVDEIVQSGQEGLFKAVLPSGVRDYSQQILNASNRYNVSPWVLAGIMYRESSGGLSLSPKGPSGTGDFAPRWSGNLYFKYANPATGLPPDGKGWGRGLMQIDYGAHNAWVTSNNWADPATNINKAASILADNTNYFLRPAGGPITVDAWRMKVWGPKYGLASPGPYPDPRPLQGGELLEAAMAAFNAGSGGVLQAIAAGLPPSAPTTGNDYVDWIVARAGAWASAFGKGSGTA